MSEITTPNLTHRQKQQRPERKRLAWLEAAEPPAMLAIMSVPFESLAELVRTRRTSMFVDNEREVPAEVVEQLCELAQWAPNHKRTWPWRFALFTGNGRARLGEAFAADMVDRDFGDDAKRAKTLTK